jgi:hypothetical protein
MKLKLCARSKDTRVNAVPPNPKRSLGEDLLVCYEDIEGYRCDEKVDIKRLLNLDLYEWNFDLDFHGTVFSDQGELSNFKVVRQSGDLKLGLQNVSNRTFNERTFIGPYLGHVGTDPVVNE